MKKIIGKILSAALALSLSLTALMLPSSAAEANFENANQAVENITVGWNLGNTLDPVGDWIDSSNGTAPYETAWGNPVTTKEMLTVVKNAGYNAVRVPVSWAQHIDNEGNIDKVWLDRVNEVVDYVISQGMYCILNTHHERDYWFKASMSSYYTYEKRFSNLWNQIATRFRNYDEKLIFEAYNEILDEAGNWTESNSTDAYEAANKFNQLFVNTVRLTGGNNSMRNLMVQTYSAGSSDKTFNNFVMPNDTVSNHIIVQVHNYDPQAFTNKDVTWTTPTKEWGSDKDKSEIDWIMQNFKNFSDRINAPVVIGEFGSMDQNNEAARARHASYFVKAAYDRGVKCFVWDDGGNYTLLDRRSLTWKFPTIVEEMIKSVPARISETPVSEIESPDVPESLKATTKSTSSIDLTWNASDGATGYNIYRASTKSGELKKIDSVLDTSYTDKGLKKGTTYYYVVEAYTAANDSEAVSEYSSKVSASATSPAPSSVTAKKSKSGSAVIKWTKSSGASGYEVFIAPKGGKFSKAATITDSSKCSYTKTGLSKGKTYNVKVRSYVTVNNKKVYSPYTQTVTVKV